MIYSVRNFNSFILNKLSGLIILCLSLSVGLAYVATMLVQKPLKRIMMASQFLSSEMTVSSKGQSHTIDTLLKYSSSDPFLQQLLSNVQSFLMWLLNREESGSRDTTILRYQTQYMTNEHQAAFRDIFVSAP